VLVIIEEMITCSFENNNKGSLRHVTVDVLVIDGAKILLIKRAKNLIEGGKWALPGGFVDRNETLEEAAKREVFEETGYRVLNTTLLAIRDNPDRPSEDRQNISFVYFCKADKKLSREDGEVLKVKWLSISKIPLPETLAFDHGLDINLYKQYLKKPLPLPVFNTTGRK